MQSYLSNTMARVLSNILFKGFRSMEYSRTTASVGLGNWMLNEFCHCYLDYRSLTASGSFLQHGMRFSTSVPNDPDTHDDFKPTNKLENSEITLKDIVEQDVKDNHVMIYMKGDPEQPRCGFSSLAVRVLSEYRKFSCYNLLAFFFEDIFKQQQQPYPVNPTNSKATYRVWGGWDVDRPCLYPQG
ncbi:putative Thioredoxin-like superfamily [Helianthus annuus]|nr:putative Thioredoxin-like superfamily [Helianthus annuus]